MPRRSILSATERESLLALPDAKDDLIRYYTFSDNDLSVIGPTVRFVQIWPRRRFKGVARWSALATVLGSSGSDSRRTA